MEALDQDFNQKNTTSPTDNQTAMWAHLIGLLSCLSGLFGLIGTMIYYFVNKDKSDFVRKNCAQALNFQIVYFIASMLVGFLLVGAMFGSVVKMSASAHNNPDDIAQNIPTGLFAGLGLTFFITSALFITNLVFCIMGAVAANKGQLAKNPLAFKMVN